MKATEILSSEHRVIERVIDAVETGASRLEKGENFRAGFFVDATDFIRGFADGCHHHKEEGVLFKMLGERGMPVDGGPVGVMLLEHEQGRALTRGLRAAAQDLAAGNTNAKNAVIENARRNRSACLTSTTPQSCGTPSHLCASNDSESARPRPWKRLAVSGNAAASNPIAPSP